MKYKKSITLAMLIFAMLIVSCQPTPENIIVRNKGNDTLHKLISNANHEDQHDGFTSIGKVSKYIEDKSLKVEVEVDAVVTVPKLSAIPVYTYEYREFTQSEIYRIVDVLCQGKKLYQINNELTVDDINERIIHWKRRLAELTENQNDSDNDNATPLTSEIIEEIITGYEELIKTTPSEFELVPVSFTIPTDENSYSFKGQTDAVQSKKESISIEYSKEQGALISYYNPYFLRKSYKTYTDIVPDNLTIDEQEAIDLAQNILQDLGEAQMQLTSIVADEVTVESVSSLTNNESVLSPYYQLTFMRSIEGIPTTYEYRYFTEDENAIPMNYERIYLYINDDGLVAFEWFSPLIQKELLNNNVGIIEFDEILQEAIKNLPLMVNVDVTGKRDYTQITIDEIRLGYMQVKLKNSRNKFMIIPVWDFFGAKKDHYTEMIPGWAINDDGWLISDNLAISHITINAVDGSVIDRDLGY
jgi:hypothetical protein